MGGAGREKPEHLRAPNKQMTMSPHPTPYTHTHTHTHTVVIAQYRAHCIRTPAIEHNTMTHRYHTTL